MKSRILTCITAIVLFATLANPVQVTAQISGGGTGNYIPIWTSSTTLGNSEIVQSGGDVGVNTTTPSATLTVVGQNGTGLYGARPVLAVMGGRGGNVPYGDFGTAGSGGGLTLSGGSGGSACYASGGTGGAILITGGRGATSAGASTRCAGLAGAPGSVILVPSGGNVGVGTTSPTAKLYVAGNFIATGSKSALVETISYGKRQLYAMESPENWFEDFGRAQLRDGRAIVNIDPVFAETVSKEYEYHVFITPKGDCKGLYVASQSATSFEVRELQRGKSTIAFDYRIVAKRKGYERARLAEVREEEDTRPSEVSLAEK
jgi:hypothetical protein